MSSSLPTPNLLDDDGNQTQAGYELFVELYGLHFNFYIFIYLI